MNVAGKNSIMGFCKYHMGTLRLIFLLIFLLCMGIGGTYARAIEPVPENSPSLSEEALLGLINQARSDPLQMAASMGLDPEQLLKDLPDLQEILTEGLLPLEFAPKLYAAARGHAEDMLAENYYSHKSRDGRSYDDRIRDAGYAPESTGELLGFLAFNNFIEPGYAVQVIFEKMLKEELDPDGTGARNILNPVLREVGVAVQAGIFEASGAPMNAYMAVVDFADPFDLYAVEKGLWRLVNEARRSPLKALEAAGLDEAAAREALGEDAWVLDQELPPLVWNEKLYGSAGAHYREMVTLGYYSTESPDGSTPVERIASTGYQAVLGGESLAYAIVYGPSDPAEIAREIYESILRAELDPDTGVEKFIFNSDPKEMGAFCGKINVGPKDDLEGVGYLVVVDFALPTDPAVFILGNVYADLDGGNLYNPGEGIEGVTVAAVGVFGEEGRLEVNTDCLGNYQLEIATGFLQLSVEDGSGKTLYSKVFFWWDDFSLLMDIPIELEGDVAIVEKKMRDASLSAVPSLAITW